MSSLIVFRRIAKRELDDAISWYEGRREGLGQEFSGAVEKQLGRIATNPDQFALIKGPVRRAILRRFPYSIFFLAEDSRIVVLAIFHANVILTSSSIGLKCSCVADESKQPAAQEI